MLLLLKSPKNNGSFRLLIDIYFSRFFFQNNCCCWEILHRERERNGKPLFNYIGSIFFVFDIFSLLSYKYLLSLFFLIYIYICCNIVKRRTTMTGIKEEEKTYFKYLLSYFFVVVFRKLK